MKREFKKQNLKTGDIVLTRDGALGIVLKKQSYIVFQEYGAEELDDFSDTLKSIYGGAKYDIIEVYRGELCSFVDYADYEPIYVRDENDVEDYIDYSKQEVDEKPEKKEETIAILAQAFYGNRTGTEIFLKDVDRFILGYLSDELLVKEPIDRTIVRIPNTKHLVLIYNKYQEEKTLQEKEVWFKEDGYVLKPLAAIPELDLEIYSRCIVCRLNEDGNLASLEKEDFKNFIHYLAY